MFLHPGWLALRFNKGYRKKRKVPMPTYLYGSEPTMPSFYNCTSITTSDLTWRNWIVTASTTTTSVIWQQWIDGTADTVTGDYRCVVGSTQLAAFNEPEPELTPDEIAANEVRQLAETVRRKNREAALRAAEDRAEQLLIGFLDEEQRAQLVQHRHFVVTGRSGRRYRIRRGRVANVDVIDRAGTITHRLCAHPRDMVPDFDGMLIQKLMLEEDEEQFARVANRHPSMDRTTIVLPALQ